MDVNVAGPTPSRRAASVLLNPSAASAGAAASIRFTLGGCSATRSRRTPAAVVMLLIR